MSTPDYQEPSQSIPDPEVGGEINLQEVAARLGVHYMTAYRYVRTGRLPARRVGGEWRVTPADVEALLAEKAASSRRPRQGETAQAQSGSSDAGPAASDAGSQPDPQAAGDVRHGAPVWQARFERQVLAGDEGGAWTVVQDALSSGLELQDVHLAVTIPTLRSVGSRWASGEVSIAEEHQASAIVQRIVARLGPNFNRPGRKRGHILVAGPAGDRHSLPISIFADLLRSRQFRVSDLGADVPVHSFVDFLKQSPDVTAVGIGVTTPGNEANVQSLIDEIRKVSDVPVAIGGAAAQCTAAARRVGADAWSGPGEEGLQLFDVIGRLGYVPPEHRLGESDDE